MQKLFYLLFAPADADGVRLRDRIFEQAVPRLRDGGASEICVFASDDEVAAGAPTRRSDPPIRAMVSFWMEDAAMRGPVEAALAGVVDAPIAGYLVAESRPLIHDRPKGRRTPGMKQITCMARRPDLGPDEFIEIWQHDHARVALETQATFGYVRNEIVRPLTPATPTPWAAIVEESFPIEALEDPQVFFAADSPEELQANLKRMLDSCARFLSFDSLEVTFVSEYYLG